MTFDAYAPRLRRGHRRSTTRMGGPDVTVGAGATTTITVPASGSVVLHP